MLKYRRRDDVAIGDDVTILQNVSVGRSAELPTHSPRLGGVSHSPYRQLSTSFVEEDFRTVAKRSVPT